MGWSPVVVWCCNLTLAGFHPQANFNRSGYTTIGTATWSERSIDDILDYICAVADHQEVFYLWRPILKDADDDMVLEVAVAASCDCIVTYNKADFRRAERFGLRIVTAKEFLEEIGELS